VRGGKGKELRKERVERRDEVRYEKGKKEIHSTLGWAFGFTHQH
jgi:hypothetical protein